jgi:hypothetical protein
MRRRFHLAALVMALLLLAALGLVLRGGRAGVA